MNNQENSNKNNATDAKLSKMMDDIVESVESGEINQAAIKNAAAARNAGAISWGSENGQIVGTLPDGSRIDAEGRELDKDET